MAGPFLFLSFGGFSSPTLVQCIVHQLQLGVVRDPLTVVQLYISPSTRHGARLGLRLEGYVRAV
jgi:hypothetical protein